MVQGLRNTWRATVTVAVSLALLVGVLSIDSVGAGAAVKSQVRGFDGTTIKVGSIGDLATFPYAAKGAEARIKRFNDTNEIKGVKLDFVGAADDKNDPATGLSEVRRLVTQEGIFGIVGDTSSYNPKDYITQQHVPTFGWGFEIAYCTPKTTSTSEWIFGYNSCQVNPEPSRVVDYYGSEYKYVSAKLNKKQPTVAMINYDSDPSRSTMAQNVIGANGAGYKVVAGLSVLPAPPATIPDYTPYVQKLLTANGGKAPDQITCLVGVECISIYNLIKAQGFTGVYTHALYTDILVKPFAGSLVTASNANYNDTNIPSLNQMKKDMAAIDPNQKLDGTLLSSYASTDMFIQALKTVAKGGKSKITPEAVQKVAANQTWQLKGLTGPTVYPIASNRQSPYCISLFESDGTQWNTVEPYTCSTKTFPFKK